MTAAASDVHVTEKHFGNTLKFAYPVVAADIVYAKTFLGLNSGNARPLTAGDKFLGLAVRQEDNSGGSAGDKRVEAETGQLVKLTVTGATSSDPGTLVYASDDQTATVTVGSNSCIGRLESQVATTTWWVRLFHPGEAVQEGAQEARILANDAKVSA